MKKDILNAAGRAIGSVGLTLKKHAPEMLVTSGIALGVTGAVMACKATPKVSEIMEEREKVKEQIDTCLNDATVEYSEEDAKKDAYIINVQTGVKLIKLYGPSIAVGALGIMSILAGHNMLRKRHVALASAYTVVNNGFKAYRKNVVDRFGNDVDKELRYDIKAQEVEVTSVDENGNLVTTKEIMNTLDPEYVSKMSPYARFFDKHSDYFTSDREYNKNFLISQQNFANEKLKSRGYLYLNDVYASLGLTKTKIGHDVGWIYDPKNPNIDSYVDFGIFSGDEQSRAFVNLQEPSILLDFNVDGPIVDMVYHQG